MGGAQGVKETTDVIKALGVISVLVIGIFGDGKVNLADLNDVYAALKNDELLGKVKEAAQGIQDIPAELKELDLDDWRELMKSVLDEALPSIVTAINQHKVATPEP